LMKLGPFLFELEIANDEANQVGHHRNGLLKLSKNYYNIDFLNEILLSSWIKYSFVFVKFYWHKIIGQKVEIIIILVNQVKIAERKRKKMILLLLIKKLKGAFKFIIFF
jgi:hypothetical protein